MNTIKTLYVSDLDGTLLNSDAGISEFTAYTLNKLIAEGMYFTIATARSEPSLRKLNFLERIEYFNVPLILMNGAVIRGLKYNKSPVLAIPRYIDHETALTVADIYDSFGIKGHMYRYSRAIPRPCSNVKEEGYFYYPTMKEAVESDRANLPVYFTATDSYEKLLPLKNAVYGIPGTLCTFYEDIYTGKYYLEIFSDKASKANAIKFMRKQFGFERVVCFGDHLNDLSMFAESDYRIAVGNAKTDTKAAADIIIDTNDNDGEAKWLINNFT